MAVPRLDLDTTLILESVLASGAKPSEISTRLALPLDHVESVILSALLALGNALDLNQPADVAA